MLSQGGPAVKRPTTNQNLPEHLKQLVLGTEMKIGSFGRDKASQLVTGFPDTQRAISNFFRAEDILATLRLEYRSIHPASTEKEIDRFCEQVLAALMSNSPS